MSVIGKVLCCSRMFGNLVYFFASYPKLFGPENLVIYYYLTNRNVKIIAIYSPVKCCINCVTNIKSTLHLNA